MILCWKTWRKREKYCKCLWTHFFYVCIRPRALLFLSSVSPVPLQTVSCPSFPLSRGNSKGEIGERIMVPIRRQCPFKDWLPIFEYIFQTSAAEVRQPMADVWMTYSNIGSRSSAFKYWQPKFSIQTSEFNHRQSIV